MKEAYVSFEVAKLLKGKGLTIPSTNYRDWLFCMYDEDGNIRWGCYDSKWYPRITHQMACAWLREKHNILISIIPQGIRIGIDKLCYGIYRITEDVYIPLYEGYVNNLIDSYEDTVEAALKDTLENLI